MNAETWQQLKTLFHAALDLDPAERAAFLETACDGDDDLRNQVNKLLASHDEPGDFLVSPALLSTGGNSADNQVQSVEPEERAGQRIGAYEIIREIGDGGMGTVFLAVRADDQYRKQVAIKLIKRGMDTDMILRRFMMERQILANLEHPNIARLLEGGSTADGLPYFVMEYIEGKPITEYCDAERLTTAQRLELFREVCAALHYAHQNLVVHRDIKPSNILVMAGGVPKLLDFGIAKLLSPGWATETEATASIVRLMTPDYASPEQFKGLSITTASDVYSLGLVLYQLLSGHRPYYVGNRVPEEIAQMILREEPLRPSAAIVRNAPVNTNEQAEQVRITPESVGRTHEGSIEKLRRRLSGDLDNIVLKAIRKEPGRRYASVQEFSDDIRRHLEGLPVIASPDTLSYRAGKFVRRNRTGVLAAAIVIITLLSATIVTTWQARVARRERDRAESRFNQVRKLANTVLFDHHERIKNLPGATEPRKKMVTDALEYLDNLSKDSDHSPDLQRELVLAYQKVGDIQGGYSESGNTGETDAALENYRKALAIQEKLISQSQATTSDRRTLAKLYINVGERLAGNGDFESQEALCRRAVNVFAELIQQHDATSTVNSDLAGALFSLASALRAKGNPDGALAEYRQAADIYEKLATANADKRHVYLRNAALTYKTMGAIREMKQEPLVALDLYRRGLAIDAENALANPNNVQYQLDYSFSFNSVASVLTDNGHVKEALEHCQKALAIQEKVVADDAQNSFARFALARTYRRLGDILDKLKRFGEALKNYQNSIRKFEEHSRANPDNAGVKARLGEIDCIFGNFLFTWANHSGSYSSRLSRLREAQAFQKRGLEIFLVLKSQNALDKPYEKMLIAVQKGLQQTETLLAER
jgi:eukaryotic-like serine/threonine-protein kinase